MILGWFYPLQWFWSGFIHYNGSGAVLSFTMVLNWFYSLPGFWGGFILYHGSGMVLFYFLKLLRLLLSSTNPPDKWEIRCQRQGEYLGKI